MSLAMTSKTPFSMKLAQYIHDVNFDLLSNDDVFRVKELLIDYLAVTIPGSQVPTSQCIYQLAKLSSKNGSSTVIGHTEEFSPEWAAYVNATSSHTLDYDDVYYDGFMHPGAIIFSTAFAVAQAQNSTIHEFIEAIIIGYDVAGCLSKAQVSAGAALTLKKGFNVTATAGCVTAAAITAKLMKLDIEKICFAMNIACYQSSGLEQGIEDEIAWALSYRFGWAAHAGILAARGASIGLLCEKTTFEGKYGYLNAFSTDYVKAVEDLKIPTKHAIHKISVKYFPCVGNIQSAISATLDLLHENNLTANDITEITAYVNECTFHESCQPDEQKRKPKTGNQAMLSLPYSLALASFYGFLGTDAYSNESLVNKNHFVLIDKIIAKIDSNLDKVEEYKKDFPATIIIATKDGKKYEKFTHYPKGDYRNPLTFDEICEKFKSLNNKLPKPKQESLIQAIQKLEHIKRVNDILNY